MKYNITYQSIYGEMKLSNLSWIELVHAINRLDEEGRVIPNTIVIETINS